MSNKHSNGLFFRTPYVLLRNSKYMRLFDAHKRGAMFRILCSRILRKHPEQLAYHNGYLSELSKRYADRKLCAYFTDEELAESLEVCEKSIKNYREDLLSAKLVKAEKSGKGYIYTMGIIVQYKDKDGYEVGAETEAFYIDNWVSMAEKEPVKLESLLLRLFGTEKMKTAQTASTTKKKSSRGKNFPENEKKVSTIRTPRTAKKPAPSEPEDGDSVLTIEDKVNRIDVNTPTLGSAGTPEYKTVEIQEAIAAMKTTQFSVSAISHARKAINLGGNRVMVERILMERAPERFRHDKMPRFSILLGTTHKPEAVEKYSEQTRLVRVYMAFKEDVTHTYTPPKKETSSEWLEMGQGAAELLEKFSYEQIIWTLRTLAKGQKNTLEFAAQGIHTLHRVMNQFAKDYNNYLLLKADKDKLNAEQERARTKAEKVVPTTILPTSSGDRDANRRRAALARLGLDDEE